MQATDIPFVQHIGIEEHDERLGLDFTDKVLNHVGTLHASAQFALAETESGMHLQRLFPELAGRVLPVLRDARVKYRQPARERIEAFSSADDEAIEKFRSQFGKKGRATIPIDVVVRDANGVVTCQATFTWFVQAIPSDG
ncbi:PaaI family thioesterase [Nitratifractor sp.]